MSNTRRWYFYIVCAVSLQAITWALIALLRNLLLTAFDMRPAALGSQITIMTFQIAVIVVGLPLFITHWRWATRSEAEGEDSDHLRLLYLYFMLSAFLVPLAFNLRALVEAALRLLLGAGAPLGDMAPGGTTAVLVASLAAVLVLVTMSLYHVWLLREERPFPASDPVPATLHQLFLLLFSALGLVFAAEGTQTLLRDLIAPPQNGLGGAGAARIAAVAQLLTGLLIWLPAWLSAQRVYRAGKMPDGALLARQLYLYLAVLITLLAALGNAAALLNGVLRTWFGLAPRSGGSIAATLLVATMLLLYHASVLREDAETSRNLAQGAAIRRMFWYLLAAVGLLAALIGLGGIISVIISALTQPGQSGPGGDALREQLASFLAVLVAALPLWLLAWRQVQAELETTPPLGTVARQAEVRRLYLYGFILLATLTFLGCAIYLVGRGLALLLGEPLQPREVGDLARAGAYALVAVLVWLYHGRLLRADNTVLAAAAPLAGRAARIVILEDGDGRFAHKMAAALAGGYPAGEVQIIPLGQKAQTLLPRAADAAPTAELLRQADIIIGPWTVASPYAGPPLSAAELGAAFATSAAQKLLLPFALPGWAWVGTPVLDLDTAVAQALQGVKQIIAGEQVHPRPQLSAGRLLLLLLAAAAILAVVLLIIGGILSFSGLD